MSKFYSTVEGNGEWWKVYYPLMSEDVEYGKFYNIVDTSGE